MEQNRFPVAPYSLTRLPSRRDVLRGLVAAGLGLVAARLPEPAGASKKRKKPRRNTFGCVDVGGFCRIPGQCCSGICEGKKGKKTCKAHDTGGCAAGGRPEICGGTNVSCTSSVYRGACATTTGQAGYCAVNLVLSPCQTDVECQVVVEGGLGPTAACIRCGETPGSSVCAIFEAPPSMQSPASGGTTP
jgi:hypothetical protein